MNQLSISVEAAFETLRLALEHALDAAWANADAAVRSKDSHTMQQALDRTRSLEQLIQQLAAFRSDFGGCVELPIKNTNPVRKHPSVNGLVRHVPSRSRTRGLNITSREEYYRPILEALVEFGGTARVADVLDRIGEKMQHHFTEDDRALLPEGGSVRWRNHAQWARLDMVKEVLLRHGSPIGVWEISEEGRAWLEKHYS